MSSINAGMIVGLVVGVVVSSPLWVFAVQMLLGVQ